MIIRQIAGALGAELHGVDLTQPLSADVQHEIRAALLQHQVIFFRDRRPWASRSSTPLSKALTAFPASSKSKSWNTRK